MKISRFIVVAVFGLGLISQNSFLKAWDLPGGSYKESCDNCSVSHYDYQRPGVVSLYCKCKDKNQKRQGTFIEYNLSEEPLKLKNNDGRLQRQ
jgi:hypothetical protein